jgi:alpha-tubulin suppressor-like RCC1 family protein
LTRNRHFGETSIRCKESSRLLTLPKYVIRITKTDMFFSYNNRIYFSIIRYWRNLLPMLYIKRIFITFMAVIIGICGLFVRSDVHAAVVSVPDVAAGYRHTVALDSAGSVWTWGSASSGEAGLGIAYGAPYPTRVPGLPAITAIDASEKFSVALDESGRVWTWGYNLYGQLGDGGTEYKERSKPGVVDIPGLPDGVTITAISAGNAHVLALASNGTVYAWGLNSSGQLGNADAGIGKLSVPTQVLRSDLSPLSGITQIAAGDGFSAALHADGSVYMWGSAYSGSLGDGRSGVNANTPYASPIDSSYLSGITKLYANWNASHLFAVKGESGTQTIYGWGNNWSGQLANGATENRVAYPASIASPGVAGTSVTEILPADSYTIIRTNDGKYYGAGSNYDYAMGAMPSTATAAFTELNFGSAESPVRLAPEIMQLDAAGGGRFAVDEAGFLYVWGSNNYYQLGVPDYSLTVPTLVPAFADQSLTYSGTVTDASAPGNAIPYVTVKMQTPWGMQTIDSDANGQFTFQHLYPGTFTISSIENLPTYTDATQSVTLTDHVSDGILALSPKAPSGFNAPQVAAGYKFTLALTQSGEVWSWGSGDSGALGTGSASNSIAPHKINFPRGILIKQIATGNESGYALDTQGRVWAWGGNWEGQLGLGDYTNRSTPTLVPFASRHDGSQPVILKIAAGDQHFLALDSERYVWTAGANYYGQLGNTVTTNSKVMTRVLTSAGTPLIGVDDIAAGKNFSVAADDGQVFTWGENGYGQLGDGTTTNRNRPVAITVETGSPYIAEVFSDAASDHVFAYSSGNVLYGWGSNAEGQLGIESDASVTNALKIPLPTGVYVSDIAMGTAHSIVSGWSYVDGLSWDGILVTGSRHFGALGNGIAANAQIAAFTKLETYRNASNETVPMPVPRAIGAGDSNSFAVLGDGSMLAWGRNLAYSLGIGSSEDTGFPRQVAAFTAEPELPTEAPTGLAFTDVDPDEGQLQGNITWIGLTNKVGANRYKIVFLNEYDEYLATIGYADLAASPAAPHSYPLPADTVPPLGARKIAVYVNDPYSGQFDSIIFNDITGSPIPTEAPTSLAFTDSDSDRDQLQGVISWTGLTDTAGLVKYVVAFLDVNGLPIGGTIEVLHPGTSTSLAADTAVPPGALHIAVFVNHTESGLFVSIPIVDVGPAPEPEPLPPLPTGLSFVDSDLDSGQLRGTFAWSAAADETRITKYTVHYVDAAGTAIGAPLYDAAAGGIYRFQFGLNSARPSNAIAIAVFVNDVSLNRYAALQLQDATMEDAGAYKRQLAAELDKDYNGVTLQELIPHVMNLADITGDGAANAADARFLLQLLEPNYLN